MKVFFTYQKRSETLADVTFINYAYDSFLEEEKAKYLMMDGVVCDLPAQPDIIPEGKYAELYYNVKEQKLFYKIEDIPVPKPATEELIEKTRDLQDENVRLQNEVNILNRSLTNAQLVLVELFESINQTEDVDPSTGIESWIPDKTYQKKEKVNHGSIIWESIVDENNVEPGTDETKWIEFIK